MEDDGNRSENALLRSQGTQNPRASSDLAVDPSLVTSMDRSRGGYESGDDFSEMGEDVPRHQEAASAASEGHLVASRQPPQRYMPVPVADAIRKSQDGDGSTMALVPSLPQDHNEGSWRPFFLRLPVLVTLATLSLALAVATLLLLIFSQKHDGLGTDNGSSAILFGWRFTPTFLAVLFAILTTAVLSDARRTEPFAQMSRPSGAPSKTSILVKPLPWWTLLWKSTKASENHGTVNYFLLAVITVAVIPSLIINPLSAALLQSQAVNLLFETVFNQYGLSAAQPIELAADQLVYFRTIGNILQNLTTSAWLTEKYAVLPFAPATNPIGSTDVLPDVLTKWQSNATVLSLDLTCEAMTTHSSISLHNITEDGEEVLSSLFSLSLADTHGCEIGIDSNSDFFSYFGGGSWFSPPDIPLPVWNLDGINKTTVHNSTEQCRDRQIMAFTNYTWQASGGSQSTLSPYFKVGAWSCGTSFYAANIPVTVSTGGDGSTPLINDTAFDIKKEPMQSDVFDEARFESAFLSINWTSVIYSVSDNGPPQFGGVSVLLGAKSNFDPLSMIGNATVVAEAQRIKQRFLGEMVMADIAKNVPSLQQGRTIKVERRVVVNLPVAVSLVVLLLVVAGLIAIAIPLSIRRSLNLFNDPSSLAAIVKLVERNPVIREVLETHGSAEESSTHQQWGEMRHLLRDGLLTTEQAKEHAQTNNGHSRDGSMESFKKVDPGSASLKVRDWRPFTLRYRGGILLLSFMLLIFAGVLVLFVLAETSGLYQSVFTYQYNLTASGLVSFAPYSIVPTLVAVILSQWWDSLVETFQRLQPFISMSRKPLPIAPVVGLEYQSTNSVGIAAKSLVYQHWLLALVSAGAVLTQIGTVSMSALWQTAEGSEYESLSLTRTLEPRTQPFVYEYTIGDSMVAQDPAGATALSSFYGDLSTNWLYSATLQLAFNGSEPAWSKDGWSFVPIELSSVADSRLYQKAQSKVGLNSTAQSNTAGSVNVTIITPALRATMQCSNVRQTSNSSSWLTAWNLSDPFIWNVSANAHGLAKGFGVNPQIALGQEFAFTEAPILAQTRTLLCCQNTSSQPGGSSAIGYWSNNYRPGLHYNFETDSGPYPRNLTVKWIKGAPKPELYAMNRTYARDKNSDNIDYRNLIWPEAPEMTAINCQPQINWANASVTVDMSTGQVWTYEIVDAPQEMKQAWSDVYEAHESPAQASNTDSGGIDAQMTVSYGVLFQDALLTASDLQILWASSTSTVEDLDDQNFVFRLPQQGLNADLMSFAMYQLANGDMDLLMDPTRMQPLAQRVFTTFFQHFASANVTADGGWGYQKIGATLPADLGPISGTNDTSKDHNTTLTSETAAPARVEIPIEILQMSPTATYLTLAILFLLGLITLYTYGVSSRHFRPLRHDFDDLAGIISAVYGSALLRQWVRDHPDPKQWSQRKGGERLPLVHLGDFQADDGSMLWGVEIVGDDDKGYVELQPMIVQQPLQAVSGDASGRYQKVDGSESHLGPP